MLIINESGLYSLILSSKMPKAKAFKHWVTSEVLPAIHKTGAYESFRAKQHIEQLEATNTWLNAAIQAVSEAKAALANVTAMRDDFIKDRDDFKEHFQNGSPCTAVPATGCAERRTLCSRRRAS